MLAQALELNSVLKNTFLPDIFIVLNFVPAYPTPQIPIS